MRRSVMASLRHCTMTGQARTATRSIIQRLKYFANNNNSMQRPHATAAVPRLVALRDGAQSTSVEQEYIVPTQEQVMIPLVPTAAHKAEDFAGWNFAAMMRGVFSSWIAHHQRLADLGIVVE